MKAMCRELFRLLYADELDETTFVNHFKKYLGTDLAEHLERPLSDWSESLFKLGMAESMVPGVRLGYNVIDQRAVELLNNHNIFFIGEYYDHNNGNIMRNEIGRLFAESISRNETADRVLQLVELDRELGIRYFEGFVEHCTSRLRNVGNIVGYEKGKIDYVQVFATLDDATTEICREMNGRIIPVSSMSDMKDKFLNIETDGRDVTAVKDDLKRLLPFWKDSDTQSIKGMSTDALLGKHPGLCLPPYHWRCRTETIAYFEEYEETMTFDDSGSKINDATKKDLKNLTAQELTNKIKALDGMKEHYYHAETLSRDMEHMVEFGFTSEQQLIDKGREMIANAEIKGFQEYFKKHEKTTALQITYFTSEGMTIVDNNGDIRGVFKYRKEDNIKDATDYVNRFSYHCIFYKNK